MYWTKRHALVCNAQHCQQKGAMDVAGLLRLRIIREGLDAEIMVNNCGTIDLCDIGPNIVVYPDNVILSGVTKNDIPAVVEYLKGGKPPHHLLLNPETPAEVERHDLYAAAVEPNPTRPSSAFVALAQEHGFDEQWIAEQQRRGFIARKPAKDDVPETITVTKKARARYDV